MLAKQGGGAWLHYVPELQVQDGVSPMAAETVILIRERLQKAAMRAIVSLLMDNQGPSA